MQISGNRVVQVEGLGGASEVGESNRQAGQLRSNEQSGDRERLGLGQYFSISWL